MVSHSFRFAVTAAAADVSRTLALEDAAEDGVDDGPEREGNCQWHVRAELQMHRSMKRNKGERWMGEGGRSTCEQGADAADVAGEADALRFDAAAEKTKRLRRG